MAFCVLVFSFEVNSAPVMNTYGMRFVFGDRDRVKSAQVLFLIGKDIGKSVPVVSGDILTVTGLTLNYSYENGQYVPLEVPIDASGSYEVNQNLGAGNNKVAVTLVNFPYPTNLCMPLLLVDRFFGAIFRTPRGCTS
jgi:hypothetical protein